MEIFHLKGEGGFDKKYRPFIAFYLQNPKKTLENRLFCFTPSPYIINYYK